MTSTMLETAIDSASIYTLEDFARIRSLLLREGAAPSMIANERRLHPAAFEAAAESAFCFANDC